jgi:hypothetical protein
MNTSMVVRVRTSFRARSKADREPRRAKPRRQRIPYPISGRGGKSVGLEDPKESVDEILTKETVDPVEPRGSCTSRVAGKCFSSAHFVGAGLPSCIGRAHHRQLRPGAAGSQRRGPGSAPELADPRSIRSLVMEQFKGRIPQLSCDLRVEGVGGYAQLLFVTSLGIHDFRFVAVLEVSASNPRQ